MSLYVNARATRTDPHMNGQQNPNIAEQASHLEITGKALALITELDEFKGSWRALGDKAPEHLASLRRVATIESVGSSTRIEGARLSDQQVEELLARIEIRSFASRDEQEVAGYANAMNLVFESADNIEISENNIRQLHRDLLRHSDKDERHRGSYKTLNNHVEAFGPNGESLGVVFETATPFETPGRMERLLSWSRYAQDSGTFHPLLVTAIFAVEFLAIHPFQDGNGRLSRILTTLQLIRAGYSYVPYSSLESVIEKTKDEYYLALRRTQGTLKQTSPDWSSWTMYFLGALKQQKDRLAATMEQHDSNPSTLPKLSARILALAKDEGQITMAEIVEATGASRDTLRHHLTSLVAKAILARHGVGRGTWYTVK